MESSSTQSTITISRANLKINNNVSIQDKIINGKVNENGIHSNKLQSNGHHPISEKKEKKLYLGYFEEEIVWKNAIGFLILHSVGVFGVYLILFKAKLVTTIFMAVLAYFSGTGIVVGAHRMYAHRGFKATFGARIYLNAMQTIAGQNCTYMWVRDHRLHHKYSDTDADPHNAKRGFFFSHIGWLMMKKKTDVKLKGKTIDMSDLEADSVVMFQKKYYKSLYFMLAFFLPVTIPYYLFGETLFNSFVIMYFTRYIIMLNVTWLVNSAAHLWGTRPFNKNIQPVESNFVAFFSMGEGWHNYHHTFPWDYRAAEFGSRWDATTQFIDLFARMGWIYDLKQASSELVKKMAIKHGDGTHHSWKPGVEMKEEDFCEILYKKTEQDPGKKSY